TSGAHPKRRSRGGPSRAGAAADVLDREGAIGGAAHSHGGEVLRGRKDADLRWGRGSHSRHTARHVAGVGCEVDAPRIARLRGWAEAHDHVLAGSRREAETATGNDRERQGRGGASSEWVGAGVLESKGPIGPASDGDAPEVS